LQSAIAWPIRFTARGAGGSGEDSRGNKQSGDPKRTSGVEFFIAQPLKITTEEILRAVQIKARSCVFSGSRA